MFSWYIYSPSGPPEKTTIKSHEIPKPGLISYQFFALTHSGRPSFSLPLRRWPHSSSAKVPQGFCLFYGRWWDDKRKHQHHHFWVMAAIMSSDSLIIYYEHGSTIRWYPMDGVSALGKWCKLKFRCICLQTYLFYTRYAGLKTPGFCMKIQDNSCRIPSGSASSAFKVWQKKYLWFTPLVGEICIHLENRYLYPNFVGIFIIYIYISYIYIHIMYVM